MDKPAIKSKTIWFNVAIALFGVLSTQTELLRDYLNDGLFLTVLMAVAAGNVYLRTITTQPISKKGARND